MIDFVLHASIVLSWFIDHSTPTYVDHVRQRLVKGARALVPAIWHLEIANSFMVAERRRIQRPEDIDEAMRKLSLVVSQSITTDEDPVSSNIILGTCRQFRLTAYDAIYLEIARKRKLPLATLDRELLAAASRAGIEAFS